MNKFHVNKLYLEVTRMCNLECLHCMRGDREDKYMSLETIDILFKNISSITTMLITGGEPFLAVEQLKRIQHNINRYGINVSNIIIVTNCSILSNDILKVLDYFYKNCSLELDVSGDKFHLMELEKRNLLEKRNEYLEMIKKIYPTATEILACENTEFIIYKMGRARLLTDNMIDEFNNYGVITEYRLVPEEEIESYIADSRLPYINKLSIEGCLYIDVNGNITKAFETYKNEDIDIYGRITSDKALYYTVSNIRKPRK